MKAIIKDSFVRMRKFKVVILCFAFFMASGCNKSNSSFSFEDGSVYPETGKYGLNILAEKFVEAKKTEWGRFEYSVRAELPSGTSLKIVIKSANPDAVEWGGLNQGSDKNWVISNVGSQFTFSVYKSGKTADASVIFTDNCIIEYYENGATEPTRVKEIKVVD